MSLTHLVNISQIGWSTDRIPLFKRVYLKRWLFFPNVLSLPSAAVKTPLSSRLLCSDQKAAALNYSPEIWALPFNGQILRQRIGRKDSGRLRGVQRGRERKRERAERAIFTERNAVSWLFIPRCLPSSEL